MSGQWIEFMSAEGKKVQLNMALATMVHEVGSGSRITFAGGDKNQVFVKEKPREVIAAIAKAGTHVVSPL